MNCFSGFEKQPVNTHKIKLYRYMYPPSHNIKRTRIYKDIYSRTFIAALLLWGKKLEAKLMPINRGMAEKYVLAIPWNIRQLFYKNRKYTFLP